MVDRISKRERLMNLVSALLASPAPLPFRDIAGRVIGYDDPAGVDALEKRFDRDKADLRRLGVPVVWVPSDDPSRAGYVIRPDEVFQQKVVFSPQEHLLLAIAGRVGAAATGGAGLEEALKSALRKLAVDLDGPDPLGDVAPITVLRSRSGDPVTMSHLAVLSQAVARSQRVTFRYRSLRASQLGERDVDPYGLGLSRGAWYLVGYCHSRGEPRVFKVSRMEGAVRSASPQGAGAQFVVPEGFRIEDHLGRDSWDFGEGPPCTVRLALAPEVVLEGLAANGRFVPGSAPQRVFEFEVRQPRALVPWVLSHAGAVRVLAPESLRDAVRETASALLSRAPGQALSAPHDQPVGVTWEAGA